jgi:hypothetical protein
MGTGHRGLWSQHNLLASSHQPGNVRTYPWKYLKGEKYPKKYVDNSYEP